MTYRIDCGGQKFFRNKAAQCGEDAVRPCQLRRLAELAPQDPVACSATGTSLIAAADGHVARPPTGGTTTPASVVAASGGQQARRREGRALLNGYKWAEARARCSARTASRTRRPTRSRSRPRCPTASIDIQVEGVRRPRRSNRRRRRSPSPRARRARRDELRVSRARSATTASASGSRRSASSATTATTTQFCKSGICTRDRSGRVLLAGLHRRRDDACPMDFDVRRDRRLGGPVPARTTIRRLLQHRSQSGNAVLAAPRPRGARPRSRRSPPPQALKCYDAPHAWPRRWL